MSIIMAKKSEKTISQPESVLGVNYECRVKMQCEKNECGGLRNQKMARRVRILRQVKWSGIIWRWVETNLKMVWGEWWIEMVDKVEDELKLGQVMWKRVMIEGRNKRVVTLLLTEEQLETMESSSSSSNMGSNVNLLLGSGTGRDSRRGWKAAVLMGTECRLWSDARPVKRGTVSRDSLLGWFSGGLSDDVVWKSKCAWKHLIRWITLDSAIWSDPILQSGGTSFGRNLWPTRKMRQRYRTSLQTRSRKLPCNRKSLGG